MVGVTALVELLLPSKRHELPCFVARLRVYFVSLFRSRLQYVKIDLWTIE
jgi:hypothetical protein